MRDLRTEIKNGTLQGVYLLYGQEEYLINQTKEQMLNILNPDGDTMNFSRYYGKDISETELIDLAETLPFFAERRVLLIEDSGFFKNAAERLPDYIKELPEHAVMIFSEKEVDKRSRMYKAVQKYGLITEFSRQKDEDLKVWITERVQAENKMIRPSAVTLLLSRTGNDMNWIATELEKLICYCMDDQEITAKAVMAVTDEKLEEQVFVMVEAISQRRRERALGIYNDLLALKVPPMRILFLIEKQYNQMLQICEMQKSRSKKSLPEIQQIMGLRDYVVRKLAGMAGAYSWKELRVAVEDMVRMEEDVKTGRIQDELSVELVIIKYSASGKAPDMRRAGE